MVGCDGNGNGFGIGNGGAMELLLGLGGNVGDPPSAFRAALSALDREHRVVALSRLYRTEPEGPPQPRYWNMAVRLELEVPLLTLLDTCQGLERRAGRERSAEVRWGPRPLDLDLLVARDVVHRGPRLELPHPRLLRRPFALLPAADVAPDWSLPGSGRTLGELAAEVSRAGAPVECWGPLAAWSGEAPHG